MKTAVEWLFEELYNKETINDYTIRVFEQAKEMEKEQNKLWWAKGWHEGHLSTLQENTETFKSE